MFVGLRHHPFIAVDNKENEIDTADTSKHVVDELFVTRNIDNASLVAIRQFE